MSDKTADPEALTHALVSKSTYTFVVTADPSARRSALEYTADEPVDPEHWTVTTTRTVRQNSRRTRQTSSDETSPNVKQVRKIAV